LREDLSRSAHLGSTSSARRQHMATPACPSWQPLHAPARSSCPAPPPRPRPRLRYTTKGFGLGVPLGYFYGHTSPQENVELYKRLVANLAEQVTQGGCVVCVTVGWGGE
jgi:hypothetical protein